MDIEGTLRFDTVPRGTRLQWLWDLKPRGVLRLMTPLLSWRGRRQEHATWTGLKRVLKRERRQLILRGPVPGRHLEAARDCDSELVESWALLYPIFGPLITGRCRSSGARPDSVRAWSTSCAAPTSSTHRSQGIGRSNGFSSATSRGCLASTERPCSQSSLTTRSRGSSSRSPSRPATRRRRPNRVEPGSDRRCGGWGLSMEPATRRWAHIGSATLDRRVSGHR
jgi:hypothetical protein